MKTKITTEREILDQAILAVKNETGLHLHIGKTEVKLNNYQVDALLHIEGDKNVLAAEVKNWAQHTNFGALVNQIKNLPKKGLLVADYVNPKMAEKLRQQDVQFIDTVGNAYITMPPTYIYVTGNRQDTTKLMPTKTGAKRAFEPTGLKVIFTFLCQPELVNAPYREIAEKAGVALGTVGWVLNGLKAADFIRDKGKKQGRHLVNYQKLLARWVEVYPEKLKSKQLLGDFIADDPYWWKNIEIQNYNGYWGGEIAAAKYTDYLKPQVATVYFHNKTITKFLADARLQKATQWQEDKAGKVEIYQAFWTDTKMELVHPILAYTDLVATGDTRNIETARRIYDKYITRYFRED
ncbi:MAG: type IV toxin-antitoxin system AbiEi family antitoxin [Thiohalomonadales bacterium]